MRIFVTGATGFIGSALVSELIEAGHQVTGLARTDAGAKAVAAAGAQAHRGDLQDLESLRSAAAKADAVIHTAFIHDFSRFAESSGIEAKAIEALGSALEGSRRPLIVTSGLALLSSNSLAVESDPPLPVSDAYPRASEATAVSLAERGLNTLVVRLPQVHDTKKQGLITYLINLAREKGISAYVGEGRNRWAAAHRLDAAHLYRLVLEKGFPGGRYHAVAEEGISLREIAETIGRGLKVPVVSLSTEEAGKHFGWLARFVQIDLKASSAETRKTLGWNPSGPDLLTDLANVRYSQE
jgi:nucleoside-diphosphate-sugar epimerase